MRRLLPLKMMKRFFKKSNEHQTEKGIQNEGTTFKQGIKN